MKSVKQMVERCKGLIDTRDVNNWENNFLKNVTEWYDLRGGLTGREVEKLEEIYDKHFA